MTAPDMAGRPARSGRSQLVTAAKLVLPLIGLALMSTLFMMSKRTDPEAAIPYASVDVDALSEQPRIGGASFATVTEDGTELTLRARQAVPGDTGFSVEALELVWQRPDGLRADLVAAEGHSTDAAQIALSGGVVMTTSTGYRLTTDNLSAATDGSTLSAPGEVRAAAPFGDLTAGAMALRPGAGGAHVLDFTGGVRLLYNPQE